jgi:hypothetical protein
MVRGLAHDSRAFCFYDLTPTIMILDPTGRRLLRYALIGNIIVWAVLVLVLVVR